MEELCKKDLKQFIQSANFAIIEMVQYLDTHPEDDCALGTYHEYRKKMKKAVALY